MNLRVGSCLGGVCFILMGAWGAVAQQAGLQQRPAETSSASAAPPVMMRVPEKLEPARTANASAYYQALRGRTPNAGAITVKNFSLKRDAGVFTFSDGTFYLFSDVGGMTTGAVFLGEGTLHVEPPSAMERKQLKIVMKTEVLDQRFTSAVFEFTDGTAAELQKASTGTAGTQAGAALGQAQEAQTLFRKDLRYDIEARLLADVGRPGGGGFFLADMKGPTFSKRLIYMVDPAGAIGVAPEEVALLTSGDGSYDVTLGFRSEKLRGTTKGNASFKVPQQTIDLTIEKSGKMEGTAVTAVTALDESVLVLPLKLFSTLRVSGVWGSDGEALDFIQEDKERDADFTVVLRKPLAAGQTMQITTKYAGKDALLAAGNGNYYLVAREDWYPNPVRGLGNYTQYAMTFHTPKNVQVVATGNRVSEKDEGGLKTTVWQTLAPIAVAGFNAGEFKSDHNPDNMKTPMQVTSYANTELADGYKGLTQIEGMALGTLSTTAMLKQATSEGTAAVQIYTDFFGQLPYDHVALTQQTACNYGQSWPMLVYLPVCYFWDDTQKQQLGLLEHDPTYWKVVTAHEVAHQWWGQTVGFESYRDQWMSEGFADFSASLFLMETRKNMTEYREFWALERRRLLEKNKNGLRPVDVGPVVMGTRVSSSRAGGDVYQHLIYPKGAYILHMLQMMFWTQQYQDQPFKAAMHDFLKSYQNKAATTEDFKAVMERNMPPWMDIEKNHKLDWFFNAYVYGTEVPKYTVTADFTKTGETTSVHFKLTQSGVSDGFTMIVPLYMDLPDKKVVLLGRATIKGSTMIEQTVNLGKLRDTPKGMEVNYYYDLLSD